jgi:hypothetical protein
MKIASIILSLLFTAQIFAGDLDFSEAQLSEALTAIDNICGDTWCEGEYNFEFHTIECSDNRCTVDMTLFSETESFEGSCTVENINSISDVIVVEERYKWVDLSESFYEELSECISNLETSSPQN